jgi:chromosome segregation ATPase
VGSKVGMLNQSNLSNSFNKAEMQKQIEMLNRHVVETGKRQESLEEVETTLMIKLDQKETENCDLKQLIIDQKAELGVKGEAIGKAQHIIQRFVEKSDDDDQHIAELKKENSAARNEVSSQSRACKEAEARLQKFLEQQNVAQTRLEGQMGREMADLR